jgi:hypothetical protein
LILLGSLTSAFIYTSDNSSRKLASHQKFVLFCVELEKVESVSFGQIGITLQQGPQQLSTRQSQTKGQGQKRFEARARYLLQSAVPNILKLYELDVFCEEAFQALCARWTREAAPSPTGSAAKKASSCG